MRERLEVRGGDTFKGRQKIGYRLLQCKNKLDKTARAIKIRNRAINTIHSVFRFTDLCSSVYAASPHNRFRGCVLLLLHAYVR